MDTRSLHLDGRQRAYTRNERNRDTHGDPGFILVSCASPEGAQHHNYGAPKGPKGFGRPPSPGCRGGGWKRGDFGHLSGNLPCRGRGTGPLNLSPPSPECRAAVPVAVWRRDRGGRTAFGPFRSPAPGIPDFGPGGLAPNFRKIWGNTRFFFPVKKMHFFSSEL